MAKSKVRQPDTVASVDPFAAPPASGKKLSAKQPILVAKDFTGYDDRTYTKNEVIDAILGHNEGHRLYEQGDAMKKKFRSTVLMFARMFFADAWLKSPSRPKNPKIFTNEAADGEFATAIFQNSSNLLDDESFAVLANLIGTGNAEQWTTRTPTYVFNNEALQEECEVIIDGKKQKMTGINAVRQILQRAFADNPEFLAKLLIPKTNFKTVKGILDKGPEFIGSAYNPANVRRLAEFMEVSKITTQIKPGGSEEVEDD